MVFFLNHIERNETVMVYVKSFDEPKFNIREIMRYSGVPKSADGMDGIIDECIAEVSGRLSYKVCYAEYPIEIHGDTLDLGFAETDSRDLKKNLRDCESIVLFAATVGIEIDRLIAKYGVVSPYKAVIFQAVGAERVEALCDAFSDETAKRYAERNQYVGARFSAGYGDLPLDIQREIFTVLDCQRKIGLTLNANMLMSPSKSVTAIMGVSNTPRRQCFENKCASCTNTNCTYRGEQQ